MGSTLLPVAQRGTRGKGTEMRVTQAVGETGLADCLEERAERKARVQGDSPVPHWVPGTEESQEEG